MSGSRVCLAVAALAAFPFSAFGQSKDALPEVGQHAVSFALPNGGGATFGIRKMISPTMNAGLEVGLDLTRSHTSGSSASHMEAVSVQPGVRIYKGAAGPVVPFLHLYGLASYQKQASAWNLTGGVGAGLGAEWFAADHVSLAGYTGLMASMTHQHNTLTSHDYASLGSGTSGLVLTLYF
jgi:hypothetical protein